MRYLQELFKRIRRANASCKGQATFEYALVSLVFIIVVTCFAVLQKRLGEGLFVDHAIRSISHGVGPNTAGVIGDVLLY